MKDSIHYLVLAFVLITTIILIPLEMKLLGFLLLCVTTVGICFCEDHFRRDMLIVVLTLALLGITPINTNIHSLHVAQMAITLLLAVILPFLITRYWYREKTIQYPFHHGRSWYKREILYIFVTAALAFVALPFYFRTTGSYYNWTVPSNPAGLLTLFLGTNALGAWDEFFFISSVLAIFRKYFSFPLANASQAVLFTSFLFALGFRSWAPLALYPFALSQGYIFKKTDSLLYVLTIHLTLDLILYLTLIHTYYPQLLPFFIT